MGTPLLNSAKLQIMQKVTSFGCSDFTTNSSERNVETMVDKSTKLDFDTILEKGKLLFDSFVRNEMRKIYTKNVTTLLYFHLGIGLFGPWQRRIIALLFLVSMASGMIVFVYTFTG